jgi:ribose 5-phosphate isomerase A
VDHLGAFPTPVEVIPFACRSVALTIEEMGGKPELRKGPGGAPYRTDEGHWILDCRFGVIEDAPALASRLSVLAGVVEHGLFIAMADQVIVARPEGVEVLERQ